MSSKQPPPLLSARLQKPLDELYTVTAEMSELREIPSLAQASEDVLINLTLATDQVESLRDLAVKAEG